MTVRTVHLADAAATEALGRALADRARAGDVFALAGSLGAGKSTLARAFVRRRLGQPDAPVPSPTFTLVQTYEADPPVWHFDLYRLESPAEAWELDIEDAFAEGISLVEWPERLGDLLPPERLRITLDHDGAGRRADLDGGDHWPHRLEGLDAR